tara:strand:+ start:482 stop:730 length:249 start_codon:yes stop_codon:yes gene_type:complete
VIKLIVLVSDKILISQIEEVGVEIGEPDCKLTEPFVYNNDETLTPWLLDVSNDNTFMISSDKILTIAEPKPTLLEKYQKLIK